MPVSQGEVTVDQGIPGATPWPVSISGTVPVVDAPSATGTVTVVASIITTSTILAANVNRKGATIYNDSTKILYLTLAATTTLTAYTVQLAKQSYYEVPYHYTGIISGLWSAANGSAVVTELT